MVKQEPLDLSKLQARSLPHPKKLWPREVDDFAPWLINNFDLLDEKLGMNLSFVDREVHLGDFVADIVAHDELDRKVIIENQFGPTDHKHFGQVVLYACEAKAKVVIWVSVGYTRCGRSPFRQEHAHALDRLNSAFGHQVAFYGVAITLESEPRLPCEPDGPCLPRFEVAASP